MDRRMGLKGKAPPVSRQLRPGMIQGHLQRRERGYLPKQEFQETGVQSLGQEDPLEEEMATCSSSLAWKIPWTEEPGVQLCAQAR